MLESPSILLTLAAFVALLAPLIFLHEMGHYWVGRWCGIKADVFSIGFGKEVAGWTDRRGTRWKIGWMPLGGYVQFAGDGDAMSTPHEAGASEPEGSFAAAALWKRALTVAAGPAANFIIAIIVLAGFAFVYGRVATPPVAASVIVGTPAATAGILAGDRILRVDGRTMEVFQDIPMAVMHRPGQNIAVDIERAGRAMTIDLRPQLVSETDQWGNKMERAIIGVFPPAPVRADVSLAEAPLVGAKLAWELTRQMAEVVGQLFTGQRSVKDLGGPIKIAQASGEQASLGFAPFLFFAALISLNLGFVNLLPMPMLDGGHLLFQAIEAVRRRPVNVETQQWAFRLGFMAMILLMLIVTFNDLGSLGLWQKLAGLTG